MNDEIMKNLQMMIDEIIFQIAKLNEKCHK